MPIETECVICHSKYKIRPSYLKLGRMKTCSRECGYKVVSEKLQQGGNGQWKGDSVGYSPLHDWVRTRKPKPKVCECCKVRAPYDLANISQKYKRSIEDFEWLCRSCHMNKDKRMNNLKQFKSGTDQ